MFSAKYDEVFINTGNIMKIHAIKLKLELNPAEELKFVLMKCLDRGRRIEMERSLEIANLYSPVHDDPINIITNVKIFLKTPSKEALKNAVEQILSELDNLPIDSLIIWYPEEMLEEPTEQLLDIWTVLEEYIRENRVQSLGIADLETEVFVSLYNKVQEKPTIYHISIQKCCSVPGDLREFAEEHDIQILTHSDPPDILPEENIMDELKNLRVFWIARYTSHIKCRAILVNKGYFLSFRA